MKAYDGHFTRKLKDWRSLNCMPKMDSLFSAPSHGVIVGKPRNEPGKKMVELISIPTFMADEG